MTIPGFGEIAERLRRSTVQVQVAGRRGGGGSGVIWDEGGLIVTNAHVARAATAQVQLWDGSEYDAKVETRDPRRDLATLRISGSKLAAATPGDSDQLRVGALVMAIGNPLGFVGAMTTGVVHALGPLHGLGSQVWVQADVRLAPGNSGGPLVDARGRVIGINTMIAGGLGLAVPGNTVADFLRHGSSGVELGVVVSPVQVRTGGRRSVGLRVLEVLPASPAAAASLLEGDVLIAADGKSFDSFEDFSAAIQQNRGVVPIRFVRGGQRSPREVAVRLVPEAA